jgi:hypothetical protein
MAEAVVALQARGRKRVFIAIFGSLGGIHRGGRGETRREGLVKARQLIRSAFLRVLRGELGFLRDVKRS